MATATTNSSGELLAVKGFIRELKNSLLFRCDWPDLVSAAPLSMSKMGACCVIAYTWDKTITLEQALATPLKCVFLRFQSLVGVPLIHHCRFDTLRANIAHLCTVGCDATRVADEKMSLVSDISLTLWDTVHLDSIQQGRLFAD